VPDVHLTVNGASREGRCEPRKLLVDFLREDLELTGTHVGCEHGICGACTVLVNGEAARSCLMLAVQADGAEITTVEGLMRDGRLHPLQEAFREHHGLQCGFCTPGMLLTALDLLRANPTPTEDEVREGMSAVLCRCTGYHGIIKAVRATVARRASSTSVVSPQPVMSPTGTCGRRALTPAATSQPVRPGITRSVSTRSRSGSVSSRASASSAPAAVSTVWPWLCSISASASRTSSSSSTRSSRSAPGRRGAGAVAAE